MNSDAGERLDPYEVLGVERGSRQDVITTAYRKLARQYHPDRYATSQAALEEIAQQKMAEINIAYAVLTDPEAARRHRHSEIRRDAATQRRDRTHSNASGTVFATSANTPAPGPGAADDRPSGTSRTPDPHFDYRRDASTEFEVSEDGRVPPATGPAAEPWTSTKQSRRGRFRRK